MPSMDIVFTQILVIMLYVLLGWIAGKSGLISPDQRKYLTRLCTDLILPFTILSASSQSISLQQLALLGKLTILTLGIFFLTTLLSLVVQAKLRTPEDMKVTTASLLTYPNCTFLGLPLCRALFGEMAVLYSVVALVAFNVLFFTWQSGMFTGKRFSFRNLVTAPSVATLLLIVMLMTGLRFPAPVQTVVSATGAMITPLSLMIIGVMMSENRLTSILSERRAYLIVLLRNLVIPLGILLILRFLPMNASEKLCLQVYLSCPCATLTTIYAIQYDKTPVFAARSVLLSTLFFAVSLPAVILMGMWAF